MDTTEVLNYFRMAWEYIKAPLFKINEANISVNSILLAFFVIFASVKIAKILSSITHRFLTFRQVDSGVIDSIGQFIRITVIIFGIIFSLDVLGFSLTSLAALGAVLMVGIGFGLQNIAQNFISGIIILIERPIKVGDIIEVGSTTGRVLEIRVRSTIVQTRDDVSIIVPNSKIVAEEVINESFLGKKIRLHVEVGVAYGSDLEKVKLLLLEAAKAHPEIIQDPKSDVIFSSFGDSSLDFDLRVWTNQLWEEKRVRSEIRFKIDSLFGENNITIPFPQQDIHIKEVSNKV
jgi:small-conductance mechanosensitive channel